jgi:Arc/MetJ-type ribon-helix-helix transcriptional regulator
MTAKNTAQLLIVKPITVDAAETQIDVLPPQLNFDNAPAWLHTQAQDHLRHVVTLHSGSAAMWRKGAIGAVLCGVELHTVKKMVGHGRFEEVLNRWVVPLGISTRTARRYMDLAYSARRALARSGSHAMDPERMLGDGQSNTDPEYQAVMTAIYNCATGQDWIDLLEELQLSKPAGRGGFHPPRQYLEKYAKLRKLDATQYMDWSEDIREDFRKWLKEEKRREALSASQQDPAHHDKRRRAVAERHWKPFLTQALIGVQGKDTWSALPKDTKMELAATLKRLAELIEGTVR